MEIWEEHRNKIVASRGSIALPYEYNPIPHDGIPAPSPSQPVGTTTLDRNHSHYLLVDDGKAEFGGEVSFRQGLLDFISFRHDESYMSNTNLTDTIKHTQQADSKRSVPVICLVAGGGPITFQTILGHIRNHEPVLALPSVVTQQTSFNALWYRYLI